MQRTDPAKFDAGRELDAMIARQVFGRTVYENPNYIVSAIDVTGDPAHAPAVPTYSTDIREAWLVIEALRAQYVWRIFETLDATIICTFGDRYLGEGETEPLAICRAAIATIQAQASAATSGGQNA